MKSTFQIERTFPGDDNFHQFEGLIHQLYDAQSIRHQQPASTASEHLNTCFIVKHESSTRARAALYLNPNLTYLDKKCACIGSYESPDDPEISSYLIEHIKAEAKELGAEYLIGPMEGSTWNSYRYSEHNEHPNFFAEPFHHIYYNEHFVHNGFEKIASYSSNLDNGMESSEIDIVQLENHYIEKGVHLRKIDLNNYEEELINICNFSLEAFKRNFLFTPILPEKFAEKYLPLQALLNPDFIWIAEDLSGEMAGLVFCLDNLNDTKSKTLIVKTLARAADSNFKGLGNLLLAKVVLLAKQRGYRSIIHAFMMQQNTSNVLSEKYAGKPYKSYALYGTNL